MTLHPDSARDLTVEIQRIIGSLSAHGVSITALETAILPLTPVPAPFAGAGAGAGIVGDPGGSATGRVYNDSGSFALITDSNVAAANKDGASGTASMRTLGTGAAQACAGNDSRLSDARTPTSHATSHQNGGSDEIATATPAANAIPKADGSNKLAAGWISEVLALADLSDVAAKSGTGTTVLMQTAPTVKKGVLADGAGNTIWGYAGFDTVSPVNYLYGNNASTGNPPTITATGTDTNISISLVPKGAGRLQENGTNVVLTTDSRLSDSRTPTAHATSHKSGRSDAIKLDELAAPTDITTLNTSTSAHGLCPKAPNNTEQWLRGDAAFARAPGRLKSRTVYLTGSGTYTVPAGVYAIFVQVVGGGGGGGGAAQTASNAAAGGGGGAGGYNELYTTTTPASTFSYAVGAKGTGGTAGNNAGTAGTDSTFSTVTAKGGSAGSGSAAGTAVAFTAGGNGGTAGSGGDVNCGGAPGQAGIRLSGTVAAGGVGGSSKFGCGGLAASTERAGFAAIGYGAGGGGGCCLGTTARAGGDGSIGCIIIWEFS